MTSLMLLAVATAWADDAGAVDPTVAETAKLRQQLSRPLDADAEVGQIVQRRELELRLLTLENARDGGEDLSRLEYGLAGPQRSRALAGRLAGNLEKMDAFIAALDEQIRQAAARPEQRILGLDLRLRAVGATAALRRAELVRLRAMALRAATAKGPTPAANAAAANAQYEKMMTDAAAGAAYAAEDVEDESFQAHCALAAGLALARLDNPRAEPTIQAALDSGELPPALRLRALFELGRMKNATAAQSAEALLERFKQTAAECRKAYGPNAAMVLDLYTALLGERLCLRDSLRAEGEAARTLRRRAELCIERLLRDYGDHHAALADILTESDSPPGRRADSDCWRYLRGLRALDAGQLPAATKDLGAVAEQASSPALRAEALWQLATGLHRAAQAKAAPEPATLAAIADLYDRAAATTDKPARRAAALEYAASLSGYLASGRPQDDPAVDAYIRRLQTFLYGTGRSDSTGTPDDSTTAAAPASALASNKKLDPWRLRLAQTLAARQDYDQALEALATIDPAGQVGAEAVLLKLRLEALAALQRGERKAAECCARSLADLSATRHDANAARAAALASEVLAELDRNQQALASCERTLSLLRALRAEGETPPADLAISAQTTRLRCLLNLERIDEAADAWTALVAERNADAAVLFRTAWALCQRAEDRMRLLTAKDDADALQRTARAAEPAARWLTSDSAAALRTTPQLNARCRTLLAGCQNELGRASEAAALLGLSPDATDDQAAATGLHGRLVLARTRWKLGDWRRAVSDYHLLLQDMNPAGELEPDALWWQVQALLARCALDGAAGDQRERGRLRIRLRQLELRDTNYGGYREIFAAIARSLN